MSKRKSKKPSSRTSTGAKTWTAKDFFPPLPPDDPIFKSTERASKPGKKNNWSVDHDKVLYGKP